MIRAPRWRRHRLAVASSSTGPYRPTRMDGLRAWLGHVTMYRRILRMRDHLILYINGRRHEVAGERAFRSLADFLRYDLGLIGTKVVCAEGDCGSCTVFIGRI